MDPLDLPATVDHQALPVAPAVPEDLVHPDHPDPLDPLDQPVDAAIVDQQDQVGQLEELDLLDQLDNVVTEERADHLDLLVDQDLLV